jgi:hypothetical protein
LICNENWVFNRYLASYLVTLDWWIYSHGIFSVHYNGNNFNYDVCCASHVNYIASHRQATMNAGLNNPFIPVLIPAGCFRY